MDALADIRKIHDLARDLIDHVLAGGPAIDLKILPAGGEGLDGPALEVDGGSLYVEAIPDHAGRTAYLVTSPEMIREYPDGPDRADVRTVGECPTVADAAELLVAELARIRVWARLDRRADEDMERAYAADAAAAAAFEWAEVDVA